MRKTENTETMEIKLHDPITVYLDNSMFGVTKHEGKYLEHGHKKYAQYEQAPFVRFVPKGKRNERGTVGTFRPFILILKGHGHPAPDGAMVPMESTHFATCSRSRYASCDARWTTDFNALINPYLDAHPECIVFDARWTKSSDLKEVDPQHPANKSEEVEA